MADEPSRRDKGGVLDWIAQLRSKRTQSLAVLTIVVLAGLLIVRNRFADIDDLLHGNTDEIAKLERTTSARLQVLDGQIAELREEQANLLGTGRGQPATQAGVVPRSEPSAPQGRTGAPDEPRGRTPGQAIDPLLSQAEKPRAEVAYASSLRADPSDRRRLRSARHRERARQERRALILRTKAGRGGRVRLRRQSKSDDAPATRFGLPFRAG